MTPDEIKLALKEHPAPWRVWQPGKYNYSLDDALGYQIDGGYFQTPQQGERVHRRLTLIAEAVNQLARQQSQTKDDGGEHESVYL